MPNQSSPQPLHAGIGLLIRNGVVVSYAFINGIYMEASVPVLTGKLAHSSGV